MVPVALLYAAGLLLAEYLPVSPGVLWVGALGMAGAAWLWDRGRPALLVALLLLTGWLNLSRHMAPLSPYDLRLLLADATPAEVTLCGRLPETPTLRLFVRDAEESYRSVALLEVDTLRRGSDEQPAQGRVLVTTPGQLPAEFHAGQRVAVTGILAQPPVAAAPGLFDYRLHLRREGIYFQLRAAGTNSWTCLQPLTSPPLTDRFVSWAQRALARGLPDDRAARLLQTMMLGWKTPLTSEVAEPFMRSGTMHIFAISGLHVALIAGIFLSLLRVCQVPRAVCGAVVIPLLWFYAAATGWQASAVRATVMMTVVVGGWALRRPGDLLNSLATAAFVILVWAPRQLFQASFQLSFCVVLSIALLLPPLERWRNRWLRTDPFLPPELLPRWRRWLAGPTRWFSTAAATSLAAWLGSLPLTAWYFHLFSPVTLLASGTTTRLASLALMSGLGSLVCGAWAPGLAELFNHGAWLWMWGMIRASETATQLPWSFAHVAAPTLPEILTYYAVLVGCASGTVLSRRRWRWAIAAVGVAALTLAVLRWEHGRAARITALPLNGGSAVFCDLPGRAHDLLVDCGPSNAVEFLVQPFLRAQGVSRLPHLLITHGDLRQIGGAELLLSQFEVTCVLAGPVPQLSPTYRRLLRTLASQPERLCQVQSGQALGPFTVLHPQAGDRFEQADDAAVVLRADLEGTRVLMLSDLGRPGQEALLERVSDLRADIVFTGLPARGEPLCDALVERIQPRAIVVLDSEFPASERAPAALRQRLAGHGVPVLYTRQAGAVQLICQRGRWTLRSQAGEVLRGRAASPWAYSP